MDLTIADASTQSRFTTFTILEAEENFVANFTNIFGDKKPKTFTVRGYALIDVLDELLAVGILEDELANGAPLKSLGLSRQAVTLGNGELVTLTSDGGSCADRAETGILLLTFNDPGSGRYDMTCTITFYPCDYLYVNAASSSAVWLPSDPT